MEYVDVFNSFLENQVNLNQSRIDRLQGHVSAIQAFLLDSEYGAEILEFSAQGSWAHGTIIKPASSQIGFDADLVVFVSPNEEWEPKQYVEELYTVFRNSEIYREKAHRANRCVVIDYAGDFHLDIVPVIKRNPDEMDALWGEETEYAVCNRLDNVEEATDPVGYTDWLNRMDAAAEHHLHLVIRLMKYLRDIKGTFSVKSVLLTTLLGMMVKEREWSISWGEPFENVPMALKTIISDLDDWLIERPLMPIVSNPVIDDEDFNRHWDQEKYDNFCICISRYRDWIVDAFDEDDEDESLKKWQKIFGDEFKTKEMREALSLVSASGCDDDRSLVEAVRQKGVQFLKALNIIPSYMHRKTWAKSISVPLRISVTLHNYEGGAEISTVESGVPVPKGIHLKFKTQPAMGAVPQGWSVHWRVTNTGNEAFRQRTLRGDIFKTKSNIRWEATAYLGVHWVDAFLINAKGICVGEERFYVVIE